MVDFALAVALADFPVMVFGCVDFAGDEAAGDLADAVIEPGVAAVGVCLACSFKTGVGAVGFLLGAAVTGLGGAEGILELLAFGLVTTVTFGFVGVGFNGVVAVGVVLVVTFFAAVSLGAGEALAATGFTADFAGVVAVVVLVVVAFADLVSSSILI